MHVPHMQLRSGETKKKGAGGKFTWGAVLTEDSADAAAALDRNDPNYDSEDDAVRAAADARAAVALDDRASPPAPVPGSSPIVQAVNKLKEDVRPLPHRPQSPAVAHLPRCFKHPPPAHRPLAICASLSPWQLLLQSMQAIQGG